MSRTEDRVGGNQKSEERLDEGVLRNLAEKKRNALGAVTDGQDILGTIPGVEDKVGEDLRARRKVEEETRTQFRRFGAEEIETPILENLTTFDMNVEDFEGEKFNVIINDNTWAGDHDGETVNRHAVTMRPENTAPVCRYIASQMIEDGVASNEIDERLFYIQPMFRNEDIVDLVESEDELRDIHNEESEVSIDQLLDAYSDGGSEQGTKSREFTQAAVEYFGPSSYAADAEIIDMSISILDRMGLDARARVNDRRLFDGIVEELASEADAEENYLQSELDDILDDISGARAKQKEDKFERSVEDLKEFIENQGLSQGKADLLYTVASLNGDPYELNSELDTLRVNKKAEEGIDALETITTVLDETGSSYDLDSGVVRGLGFYTGPIFQTDIELSNGNRIGEAAGGGRYDELVGDFLEDAGFDRRDVPATGFAWGIDRVVDALQAENLVEEEANQELIIYGENPAEAQIYAEDLREEGYNVRIKYDGTVDDARRIAREEEMSFEVV